MEKIIISDDTDIPYNQLFDTVLVNTYFEIEDLHDSSLISMENPYIKETNKLIEESSKVLKDGGLLFIYGLPKYLPLLAVNLNKIQIQEYRFLFKYWIGIEFTSEKYKIMKNSHIGLLIYQKTKSLKKPPRFFLDAQNIRIPYKKCEFCNKDIKDWGGKKHLINPLGAAISDVWSDLDLDLNNASNIPSQLVKRVFELRDSDDSNLLIIKQRKIAKDNILNNSVPSPIIEVKNQSLLPENQLDKIIHINNIEYMKMIKEEYPGGIFDLVFADPPYNLSKNYDRYKDAQEDFDYIVWCNEWLQEACNILKPGGTLLVLNIPKWAIYHAAFLLDKMNFQHWIVWDALSMPAGKLLPAHYSLLYFTKPGGIIKSNYENIKYVENRKYCSRLSCVNKRKLYGKNDKEIMSDIWINIHRLKHKRDRDQHPCQLPTKLMDRIIPLFTKEGDLVYDPFGGAGTTAISSKIYRRKFVITELDPKYVEIAQKNLNAILLNDEGDFTYNRKSVKKEKKNAIQKKNIELFYIELCLKHEKALTKDEIKILDSNFYELLIEYNGNFNNLMNVCNRHYLSKESGTG